MKLGITIAQVVVFVVYVVYIYRKFGVLSSISASSLKLTGLSRWWFFAWLGSLGILTWFHSIGYWGDVMSLGFVSAGLTIDHKSSPKTLEDDVHMIGTLAAIGAGTLSLIFLYGIWMPTIVGLFGSFLCWQFTRNWIWWTECLWMAVIAAGQIMAFYGTDLISYLG